MTAEFYVENGCLRARGLTRGSAADCLAKREKLYALAVSGELVSDGGSFTCAFCQAYRTGWTNECAGCPIEKITGAPLCHGTACDNYVDAVGGDDVEAATEAADSMVNLLTGIWRNEQ